MLLQLLAAFPNEYPYNMDLGVTEQKHKIWWNEGASASKRVKEYVD
jgi:hypothetical protein